MRLRTFHQESTASIIMLFLCISLEEVGIINEDCYKTKKIIDIHHTGKHEIITQETKMRIFLWQYFR